MFYEIITGTPWWVYLLLIVLIYRGVRSLSPRRMKLMKLFIMPIIFVFLFSSKMGADPATYLMFLAIGCCLGWFLYRKMQIKADKIKKIILIPGSIIPLILIIFGFCQGYFMGYETAVHPEIFHIVWVSILMVSISGILSGIFIGRTALYLHKYIAAKHEDLSISK